jgi:hypothetical protein
MVSPPIPLIHRHRLNATLRCTSLCGVQPATVVGRRKTTPSAKSHPGPYQACRLTFFTSTMAELQTDSSLYLDTIVLQVQ